MISIIMPAYNVEKYISQAIESVISQSYENWELLVIDDNSNDNTVNIVKAYLHDRRIKLFINMKNKGAAETRNTGLDNAIGKYICFLDADDYWDKDKLSSQYIFMEQNNVKVSYMSFSRVLSDKTCGSIYPVDKVNFSNLLKSNVILMSSSMVLANIVKKARFKNVRHEDYVFWLDLLRDNNFYASRCDVKSIQVFYRVLDNSLSSNKFKSALWTWNIYYRHENLGLIKSLYYFMHYAYNGFIKHKLTRS